MGEVGWISVKEILPEESAWVLGLCDLINNPECGPVVFQVKRDKQHGWTDWCGDIQIKDGWEVKHWMPMPEDPKFVLNFSGKPGPTLQWGKDFNPENFKDIPRVVEGKKIEAAINLNFHTRG